MVWLKQHVVTACRSLCVNNFACMYGRDEMSFLELLGAVEFIFCADSVQDDGGCCWFESAVKLQ